MSSLVTASASPPEAAYSLSSDELTRCLQGVLAWREKQEQSRLNGDEPTMEPVTPPAEAASPWPIRAATTIIPVSAHPPPRPRTAGTDHDRTSGPAAPAAEPAPQPPRQTRTARRHASAVPLVGRRPSEAASAAPSGGGRSGGGGGAAYVPQHAAKQFLLTTGGRSAVRYGGSRQTSRVGSTYGSRNASGVDLSSGRSEITIASAATAGRSHGTKGTRSRDGHGALRPWRSMGAIRRDYRAEEDVPEMPSLPVLSNHTDRADDTTAPVDAAAAAAAAIQEHATVDWTQSDELRTTRTREPVPPRPPTRTRAEGAHGHETAAPRTTEGSDARPLGLLRRIKTRLAGGSRAATAAAAAQGPAGEKPTSAAPPRPSFLSFIGFRPDDC